MPLRNSVDIHRVPINARKVFSRMQKYQAILEYINVLTFELCAVK